MMPRLKVFVALSLATLCAPMFGANPARPGTLNYIEGSAYLEGKLLTQKAVGSTDLDPGQVLSTTQGKVEILLTPGVFLRLDGNSSVKMISPNLTFTQLSLERGRATVEVDEIHPQNDLQIVEGGVSTELLKTGLYEFNANSDLAEVFSGKAATNEGEGKWVVIKGHHELAVNAADARKPQSFDTHAAEDELYNWSSLRSQYLSESNAQLSQEYAGGPGLAPGWYWDPFFLDYTFMGPDPFFSPFGWGFYPFGYGGFYGGFYGRRGFYGGRGGGFHGGGFHGGGFHGGGGFHAGGGGHR
jgi:uncharacterized membrane protein YgcG